MPYVDLHCADDYASIFYRTNTPYGNVGGFDTEKPSIIILHPLFLDSTWLDQQFGDPRLDRNYNIIAFDMRSCGMSRCRPSGRHDSWVEAADLACCHQILNLPPCHILALETLSVHCAIRFAVLFPEMCLSLTLCNVPPPTELPWVITAYSELFNNWCLAEDLESFEHAAKEGVEFVVGPDCDLDLRDELIAYWETSGPPSQRLRTAETLGAFINRPPLKAEVYASITQPVLLIHGERNETCPKQYAEMLVSELTNAEGGAKLCIVKGGSSTLSIVPGHASIANRVFVEFISRLPHKQSVLAPPEMQLADRMKAALITLAQIMGDPTISSRDPFSSLSFSCLLPSVVKSQTDALCEHRKGLHNSHSPLGLDGKPIRKYSDRRASHWFHGGKKGLSIVGTSFLHQDQPEKASTQDFAHDGRIRQAACGSNALDKFVIKGSMAKVVGTQTPFQRLLV